MDTKKTESGLITQNLQTRFTAFVVKFVNAFCDKIVK